MPSIKKEGEEVNTANYYLSWEEYRAAHPEISDEEAAVMAPKLQGYEEMMLGLILFLCV
jgi:hypothetical protein